MVINITVGGPIDVVIEDGVYYLDDQPITFPLVVVNENSIITIGDIEELETILANPHLSNL